MTRVLIATAEPIRARGLETVLTAGGLEVAAVCRDVFELFERLQSCRPDVAIIDMTVLPAPEIIQDLSRLAPQCQLVEWPRLTLSDSPARVAEAIHMMAAFPGHSASPPALLNLVFGPGEREVVTLVAYGLTNGEIAAALGSSRSAVQKLLKSLSERLGIRDRCELALFGLTTIIEGEYHNGKTKSRPFGPQ